MGKTLEAILWGMIGLAGLGLFNKAKAQDNFVDMNKSFPVALGRANDFFDIPDDVKISKDWIIYDNQKNTRKRDKIMGICRKEGKYNGARFIIAEGNEVCNPDIDNGIVVYESKQVTKNHLFERHIHLIDLWNIDYVEPIGNNLYRFPTANRGCLTGNLFSDLTGKRVTESHSPQIDGGYITWVSRFEDPNNSSWQEDDEIMIHEIQPNSIHIDSNLTHSALLSGGVKEECVLAGNFIAYSLGEDGNKKIKGYEISTNTEFEIENSNFFLRDISMVNIPDLDSNLIAYLDGTNEIKFKYFRRDGDELRINQPQDNIYNVAQEYNTMEGCESPKLFGNLDKGFFLAYNSDGIRCLNLKTWDDFHVFNPETWSSGFDLGDVKGGYINENNVPSVFYVVRNYRPEIKESYYPRGDLKLPTKPRKYNALVLAEIVDKPKALEGIVGSLGHPGLLKSIQIDDNYYHSRDINHDEGDGNYYLGDINKDGVVDSRDEAIIQSNWWTINCNKGNEWGRGADINQDGFVNNNDWDIYQINAGRAIPGFSGQTDFSDVSIIPNLDINYYFESYWNWEDEMYYEDYFYLMYWDDYFYSNNDGSTSEPKPMPEIFPQPQKHIHYIDIFNKTFGDDENYYITKIEIPTERPYDFSMHPWDFDYFYYSPEMEWMGFYPELVTEYWGRDNRDGKITFIARSEDKYLKSGDFGTIYSLSDSIGYQYRPVTMHTSEGILIKELPVPLEHTLRADFDRNGYVGLGDLIKFSEYYYNAGAGDLNWDFKIDMKDFARGIAKDWGKQEKWFGENYIEY